MADETSPAALLRLAGADLHEMVTEPPTEQLEVNRKLLDHVLGRMHAQGNTPLSVLKAQKMAAHEALNDQPMSWPLLLDDEVDMTTESRLTEALAVVGAYRPEDDDAYIAAFVEGERSGYDPMRHARKVDTEDDSCAAEDPTEHLLNSPVNAARSRESIKEWADAKARRMAARTMSPGLRTYDGRLLPDDDAVIDSRDPGPFRVTITYPPVSAPLYETLTFDEDQESARSYFGTVLHEDEDCRLEVLTAEEAAQDSGCGIIRAGEWIYDDDVPVEFNAVHVPLPNDAESLSAFLTAIAEAAGFLLIDSDVVPLAERDPVDSALDALRELGNALVESTSEGSWRPKLNTLRARITALKEEDCDD